MYISNMHTSIFIRKSMIMLGNATCYPVPTTLSPFLFQYITHVHFYKIM